MSIRPLSDNIVVKILENADQTSGGIFIPDSAKEKSQKGEVIAVGTGRTLDSGEKKSMEVKVGDKVLFGKYAGTDVKLNDQILKILSEKDVLGIIE